MLRALLLLTLLLPLWAGAQNITVSDNIPLRTDTGYDLIGKIKGNTILLRSRANQFEVQAFDERMRESWTKELELDKRTPTIITTIPTENYFTVIYFYRDRSHTLLKAHRYDAAANLRDSVTLLDLGFLFYTPDFQVVRSEDRTKLLIYYNDNQNTIRVISVDLAEMRLLWDQELKPEDFYFNENFTQALVDNAGAAHLILQRDNYRSRRKQHYYEMHSYPSITGELWQSYNISLGDLLTYDVFFDYDNLNDHLIGGGLYSDRDYDRALGYFYLSVDPFQPKEHLIVTHPFGDQLIEGLKGEEIKTNKGIQELSVRDVVLRRDGGILLVLERNRQLERRTGSASRSFYDGAARLMVDYYYDELIVQAINPDGTLHWENILHKKQYSQDDNGVYSSYFLFKTPGQLRFLFNDEVRYENTVSEYVLTGLGDFDRNSLFNTKNLELRLRFRDAVQVGSRELIVPSERRNRLRLVRLTY